MKILVSAAEISSDIQAEACIRALYNRLTASGATVELSGIGGPLVRSLPGFRCLEPAENLRTMGVGELLKSYLYIRKVGFRLIDLALEFQPDMIITFDYPNFHLEMMEKLKPRIKNSPVRNALKICAIPPKLWVWRAGRIKLIKRLYDGVLVILPFEKDFYQQRGVHAIYEGNPLIASLPYDLSQTDALSRLGCDGFDPAVWTPVAVLPGSRDGELAHNLPVLKPALEKAAALSGRKLLALVPVSPGASQELVRAHLTDSESVVYRTFEGRSHECMRAAPVGLIKSGTSTLEAVMLGCCPVIYYKTGLLTELTFRLVTRYLGPVGLPNILLGIKKRCDALFPEYLGPEATPEALAQALAAAIENRGDTAQHAETLKNMLVPHDDVPGRLAERLIEWHRNKMTLSRQEESRV